MNSVKSIFIVVALGLCLIGTSSCKGKSGQKDSKESETRTTVQTSLLEKTVRTFGGNGYLVAVDEILRVHVVILQNDALHFPALGRRERGRLVPVENQPLQRKSVFDHQGNELVVYDILHHRCVGCTDVAEHFEMHFALRE